MNKTLNKAIKINMNITKHELKNINDKYYNKRKIICRKFFFNLKNLNFLKI